MRSLSLHGAAPVPAESVAPWVAKGFRPFFLSAGLFATLIVPLWLLALASVVRVDGFFDPIGWHAHEMVFGFAVAVIAGFLLTAAGNWTGAETAVGGHLVALVALWGAGRVALAAATLLPRGLVAVIELSFLPALAFAIGRPLVKTGNRRNYVMLGVLLALFLADLASCLDALGFVSGFRQRANLAAVDVVTLLIVILSSRIFPMFTRNATGATVTSRPKLDVASVIAMAALVLADVAVPGRRAVIGVLAIVTAVLVAARASGWGAQHTAKAPLLWILHVGHAWVAVGLLLRGLSALVPSIPASSGLHALTAGGIGCTTLGMMARVSLGHTGRQLAPSPAVARAFALVSVAALVRVVGPFFPAYYRGALWVAGTLWTLAFGVFVVSYARLLVTARPDGKPG